MSHCGNLDNNAESSADDGGLTCEVLERRNLSRLFMYYFVLIICGSSQLELKNQL